MLQLPQTAHTKNDSVDTCKNMFSLKAILYFIYRKLTIPEKFFHTF